MKSVHATDDSLAIPASLQRDPKTNAPPSWTADTIVKNATPPPPKVTKAPVKAKPAAKTTPPKVAKVALQPKGTFKLAAWAKGEKLDPRNVRKVARTIKGELSKLYVNKMKYVFKDSDKAKVAKMINDGLAAEKPAPKSKKAAKKKGG